MDEKQVLIIRQCCAKMANDAICAKLLEQEKAIAYAEMWESWIHGANFETARPQKSVGATTQSNVPQANIQCTKCNGQIKNPKVADYSAKHYGRILCYPCQETEKKTEGSN